MCTCDVICLSCSVHCLRDMDVEHSELLIRKDIVRKMAAPGFARTQVRSVKMKDMSGELRKKKLWRSSSEKFLSEMRSRC